MPVRRRVPSLIAALLAAAAAHPEALAAQPQQPPTQQTQRAAPAEPDLEPGITVRLYQLEGEFDRIPRLIDAQTPNADFLLPRLDIADKLAFPDVTTPFLTIATGYLRVERAGEYTLRLRSDDGSRLYLNNELIINHDGRHGVTAKDAAVALEPGLHKLRVEHFDAGGNSALHLEWRPPEADAFTYISSANLRAEPDATRVTSPGPKRVVGQRRAGDGRPLNAVHPSYSVIDIRPEGFEPMVGAMALLPDGRLAVGTFFPLQRDERVLPDIESKDPDVLHGVTINPEGQPATVEVIATGLYEPAGMAVVNGNLYVAQRREVTRLRDTDNDGFFETHETVAGGWEGWNYHQFAMGLVAKEGKLYTALSTAMAPPRWQGMNDTNAAPNGPMRGSIVEIDPTSNNAVVIAGGVRTPNGLGLGPDNQLFYLDNQGTWMPTSILAHVVPGRFYGHHHNTNRVENLESRFPDGGHPAALSDLPRAPTAVYLPQNEFANSPTQPLLIEEGPYAGQMLVGELTAGGIRRIALERVNGEYQGAAFRFTQGLEVGVNRMALAPDGTLYIGGIGGNGNWNWKDTRFGLQMLKPTGDTPFEMRTVSAHHDGFTIEFTKPADRDDLANPANYEIQDWTYQPTAAYGGPKVNTRTLTVTSATPTQDGTAVRLVIDDLKPGRCVHIRTDPTSAAGEQIWSTEAFYTLHTLPRQTPPKPSTIAGQPIDPNTDPSIGLGVGVFPPHNAVVVTRGNAQSTAVRGRNAGMGDGNPLSPEQLAGLSHLYPAGFNSRDLVSRGLFADARIHVEWRSPPGGAGQLAGNSGVYIQQRYEIQVLNTPPGEEPQLNTAGAVYNVAPASTNASRGPGEWQAYDIFFRAARFNNGQKTDNARITVYWNGTLIHDDLELTGPTGAGDPETPPPGGTGPALGPLLLQDHPSAAQGPVEYRNIWIAPLEPADHTPGEWTYPFAEGIEAAGWQPRGGQAVYTQEAPDQHTHPGAGPIIVGTTRPNTPNTFLTSPTTYANFELIYEVKVDNQLNSGVQIRSEVINGFDNRNSRLRGYQVELDPSPRAYTAGIFDEARRGWLHTLADMPYARRAFRNDEWNTIRVVAKGPVIRTWINGVPAANLHDALTPEGHIGLQVHGVGGRTEPLQVRWRNLRLRQLQPAQP